MVRTVVSGICGRTGMLVAKELAAADGVELVGGVEASGHASVGRKVVDVCGAGSPDGLVVGALSDLDPDAFDVLVDFSVPEQSRLCAEFAAAAGTGLVVATTGLTETQTDIVRAASSRAAVVLASNTSVGANVLFALLGRAAAALGEDFDIEIVEAHHRGKRDAPSGTALAAADILARARGKNSDAVVVSGRSGPNAVRNRGEIGVHSVRGGSIAGRHTIYFLSSLETLALEHVALSREAFAVGAVRAARFAAVSEPGLYDMLDVLGLRDAADREGSEGNAGP
ncbi:MAG: 4-hydroxy-tetrahydrodipicolinate reductase [Candidatus Eisenbacteria sp.]|nr:4-hydroxy-tetrahydrodipicolinate reductase [Candidatus Eisenbacteria bacterium]